MAVASVFIAANAMLLLHDEITSGSLKEAQDVPATLPPAVGRSAAGAVKVEYRYDGRHDSWSAVEGSGAKIGPGLVLTAGHVVLKGNPGNDLECEGSSILSELNGYTNGSWRHQILNRNAVYNPSNYTAGEDLAALRVQRDSVFDRLPTARVAADQPATGQTVFFVNYETGGPNSDVDHYPSTGLSGRYLFRGDNYDHPAEYAGTVVGQQGPYLLVATGEASYGPQAGREFNSYPGASGGPVYNRAGNLIGEVVAIGGYESVSDISSYQGVKLQSKNPRTRQLSIVQPITRDILKPVINGLPKDPIC